MLISENLQNLILELKIYELAAIKYPDHEDHYNDGGIGQISDYNLSVIDKLDAFRIIFLAVFDHQQCEDPKP
jgi:hypothetical protein